MSDVLDRMKGQRGSKPKVNLRDTSVKSLFNESEKDEENDIQGTSSIPEIAAPQAEQFRLPELKKLTIRLEESIHGELEAACSGKEDPTRETLIEAAWVWLQDHPEQMKEVVQDAKRRHHVRLRQKQIRRIATESAKLMAQDSSSL